MMRITKNTTKELNNYLNSDLALSQFYKSPFEKLYLEARDKYIDLRKNDFFPHGYNLQHETWKNILGYEGLYCVSNFGRIKSIKNDKNSIRSLSFGNQGYLSVSLSKEGKTKSYLVHRLVSQVFIPNEVGKLCVNHKNSLRYDNRSMNLEWVTSSENSFHSYAQGKRDPDSNWVYVCRDLGIATLTLKDLCDKLYKRGHHSVDVNDLYKIDFDHTFSYKGIVFEVFERESMGKISYSAKMKMSDLYTMLADWYVCGGYYGLDINTILDINKIRYNIPTKYYRELIRTAKSLKWKTCENMRLRDKNKNEKN